jgi:hypothetical protein
MRGTKKRLALICGLLVMGLMLIALGSVSGVAAAFQGKPVEFKAKVTDGNLVLIQEDTGKEILIELTSREKEGTVIAGTTVIIEGSTDGIHVKVLTKVKKEVQQPSMPRDEELLEIAKKDKKVQEFMAGKDYKIVGKAIFTSQKETTAVLLFEVQGKYYEVVIDLNNKTVKSVEESPSVIILAEG